MTIHECKKCSFITDNNFNYQKHLKTQKHRRNVGAIGIEKTNQKTTEYSQKPTTLQPKNSQKPTDIVLYECDYCDSVFRHSQSKYKHQKYRCKAKKTFDEKDKRIEELEKQLSEAMKRFGVSTTTNNTNHNTNHNTSIDNSRNIHITINAYGNEDLSYLKDGDWLKMLTKPQESVVNLFLETHFNPEHPENANIRLRNRNSKFMEVHDGDNWKNKKKKKMLSEIADDKQGTLDNKFSKDDDIQNKLTKTQQDAHGLFHDEVYYNNKREIMDEMEGALLDNK